MKYFALFLTLAALLDEPWLQLAPDATLTPQQQRAMSRIKETPSTIEVHVVEFNPVKLEPGVNKKNPPLKFELSPTVKIEVAEYEHVVPNILGGPGGIVPQKIFWKNDKNSGTITISGYSLSGRIDVGKDVFVLENLTAADDVLRDRKHLQAVIKYDGSKSPKD